MSTELLRALDQRLREAGVVCTFEDATPDAPLPRVLMRLSDEKDVVGIVTAAESELLQLFVGFRVGVPHDRASHVARTICAVNATLPFGSFELFEGRDPPLSFRAVAPRVAESWDVERVVATLGLALGVLGRFVPIVVGVADGEIDYKEAKRRLSA